MIPALSAVGPAIGLFAAHQVQQAVQAKPAQGADGTEFGGLLAAVGKTIDQLKQAEAMSISAIKGETSVQQVVEAVLGAEHSLQTALAIRDKAVSAYQVLSQMAI
jgi:flagellar hook-basal body complex protein FliE